MNTREAVQNYYGQQLTGTADLKTSACCDADAVPAWLKPLLAKVLSGDEPAPAPVAVAAAPQKSVGESTRSSSVSEAPLTLEGLIEASIKNKEEVLGRELDAEEKMEIASKVTRLMAAKK